MHYLTIEQRESLERALNERVTTLRAGIAAALRQSDAPQALHLANRFEESGDDALADLEQSLEIASVQRDVEDLARVRVALARIHTPEFGECEDCDAIIPFSRLQAEPTALRCVACQRAREHRTAGGLHPSL
ncbi:MAG: TraR/DksA family transcriptional regulator [Burkholderiales bacterium]